MFDVLVRIYVYHFGLENNRNRPTISTNLDWYCFYITFDVTSEIKDGVTTCVQLLEIRFPKKIIEELIDNLGNLSIVKNWMVDGGTQTPITNYTCRNDIFVLFFFVWFFCPFRSHFYEDCGNAAIVLSPGKGEGNGLYVRAQYSSIHCILYSQSVSWRHIKYLDVPPNWNSGPSNVPTETTALLTTQSQSVLK